MKKILAGALIALASVLIYKSCVDYNGDAKILKENTMLIQQRIQNVSKLIVTEGHFAEVYNYEDSKALFGNLITADKKALVVVNAEVAIAYDLKKVDFRIDSIQKTVFIDNLPNPEIKISPDFEYYDVSADYFNPFGAEDYNQIKKNVNDALLQKIEGSNLISNAENRLVTELSHLLVFTQSRGWKLVYENTAVTDVLGLQKLLD